MHAGNMLQRQKKGPLEFRRKTEARKMSLDGRGGERLPHAP